MRSLGPGGGSAMGGGGSGGGGMMRTVKAFRGIGGAAGEPFPHSTTTTNTTTTNCNPKKTRATSKSSSNDNSTSSTAISLSSAQPNNQPSPFSSLNHPIGAAAPASWGSSEEADWECVDGGSEVESVNGCYDDFVFGTVPSKEEVHHAVSSLQQVFDPVPFSQLVKDRIAYNPDNDSVEKIISPTVSHKSGSEDWIEPSLHVCETRNTLQSTGSNRVYDAFHLLQHDPSIKRMVISLSSDKAVWDAVMNNEVVRELRDTVHEAEKSISETSDKSSNGSNPVLMVLRWMFVNTKAKVIEIVEKITKMVLFQPQSDDEKKREHGGAAPNPFQEKLRSSFILTVVVLLLVVVNRSKG